MVEDQLHLAVALWVTQDMKPSFRVVAYYSLPWHGSMEVVSDSIWVDLDDGCVGGVSAHPPPHTHTHTYTHTLTHTHSHSHKVRPK